jgi:hypothetical protein
MLTMGASPPGTVVNYSEKTPAGFRVHATRAGASSGSVTVDWIAAPYR